MSDAKPELGKEGKDGRGRTAGRTQKIFARRDCPADGPQIPANLASENPVRQYWDCGLAGLAISKHVGQT